MKFAVLSKHLLICNALLLAACSGGTGGDNSASSSSSAQSIPASGYAIGGTVAGLASGATVVLHNNGGSINVTANGPFAFPEQVTAGNPYSVTVATQPASPAQTCTVTKGWGTANINVTDVSVTCATESHRVSGTATGLKGSLVAQNNGGDDLTVSANGAFIFPVPVASGAAYTVTLLSQQDSAGQKCSVSNGSGVIGGADATDVVITCTP